MKRISLLSALILATGMLVGCQTGQIKYQHDDFKGVTVATMKLTASSTVSISNYTRLDARFSRNFTSDKKQTGPVTITMVMTRNQFSLPLKKEVIFKINEEMVNLSFGSISAETQTQVSRQTTKTYETNADGGVDFTQPSQVETKDSSQTSKVYTAIVDIPEAVQKKLGEAKDVSIRVYFGTDAGTFEFKEKKLESLKNFMTALPPAKSAAK